MTYLGFMVPHFGECERACSSSQMVSVAGLDQLARVRALGGVAQAISIPPAAAPCMATSTLLHKHCPATAATTRATGPEAAIRIDTLGAAVVCGSQQSKASCHLQVRRVRWSGCGVGKVVCMVVAMPACSYLQ